MDAAARTAHDSTLQPFSEMEHYKHADELPPEIMADSYDKLERLCLKYMNEDDFSKVEQAYCFAAEKHCNQKRRSGEMYINHPVEVAIILADLKMDCDVVCAALLHDTVEDTETSLADVSGLFGDTVAELVDGVTKLTNIEVDSMDEKQALTLRKMFLAMSKDIRVIIVKLADRLHNMRTLAALREDRRLFKARETMDVYAPLADRLGMSSIKWELEDLSFFYLEPDAYQRIARMVAESREVRERYLAEIIKTLTDELNRIGLEGFQINGRSKHYWSIYQKMKRKGKEFSEIYDLVALRVITHSVRDCYSTLGAVHTLWHPMPGRFKDYIAMPKVNNYQSLHTTVIGREGIPFEVQIRTQEMHNTAQYGVAAHWKYKAGISGNVAGEKRFDWIRQLLEQQQEADDVEQISEAIKVDLAPDDVYVFTPKGDVITLPAGSNVIDFAYAIHTQVGNKMTGAKVGGRMVPFDHTLHTGDIVEILTSGSDNYGPNRNWSEIAKTNEAKAKIRAWFKRERREENIECGKAAFEKEIRRNNIAVDDEILLQAARRQRLSSVDDLYAAIGYGGVQLSKIITRLKEEQVKQQRLNAVQTQPIDIEKTIADNNKRAQKNGVVLDGIEDCAVKYAQCCNPLPGDDIMGFITRGYGVSIHKADCQNVKIGLQGENKDRWIKAHWAVNSSSAFRATIDIIADDRTALIADITTAIASNHLPIHEINAHYLKNGNANIILTIEVSGIDQLKSIILRLQKIPGVISAERTGKQ